MNLNKLSTEVIEENPDKVNNYHLGKKGLLGFFLGEVMKKSKGKADPHKALEFIIKDLTPENKQD
ncbi:MAG: hypothetical protein ACUZ8E_07150 [Candidatus Anammoxibacter sp.]